MKRHTFGALVLAACSGAAAQTGTLDQVSTWTPTAPIQTASFNLSAPSLTWQQQIRVGIAGQLEGLRLPMTGNAGAQMTLKVRLGPAWSTATEVFSTTVTKELAGQEVQFINMTAANVQLLVNDLLVFETMGNGTGMNMLGTYAPPATTPGPAYAEPLFLNSSLFADNRWRHGFESYVITGSTPCYPNCDQSTTEPILNVGDFTCFLQRYAAGESYANCDESTVEPVLNVGDFTCFLQAYAAGCR